MPSALELLGAQYGPGGKKRQAHSPVSDVLGNPPPAVEPELPDAVVPKNQGAFLSALNYIARPGQVVKNVLTGNLEGALRQTGDFIADPIDAILPGDLLPELSRPKDYVEGSELLGLSEEWRKEHPFLNVAASLPVDILTDPLTYVGLGPLTQGAKTAGNVAAKVITKLPKGAEALAKGAEVAEKGGMAVRSIFGAQRKTAEAEKALGAQAAARSNEARAGLDAIKGSQALSGLSPQEAEVVGDILDNFKWEGGQVTGELLPGSKTALDRLAAHPGVTPENAPRIQAAVQDAITIGQNQAKRAGIFRQEGLPEEYLGRGYKGQSEEQRANAILGIGPEEMGQAGATQARKLPGAAEVAEHLKMNPGVKYERNALARLAERAQTQGTLAGRADLGKSLLGDAFTLTDDVQRKALTDKIRGMAGSADPIERESAKVLHDSFKGLSPRGPILDKIASVNRVVKPMLVYGFAIPKIGSIIRNKTGGVWQALSNPASRPTALAAVKRLPSDLAGAVVDSLNLSTKVDDLGRAFAHIDNAFKTSGGAAENAIKTLEAGGNAGSITGQQMAELVRSGVLDGFVRSEDLLKEIARTGVKKKLANMADWPGRMFRGVEDRMRVGMWLDLTTKHKKTAQEAAQIVKDSLYDYSVSSIGNRTARDLLPFFQFTAKAIPQQTKFLAEKPWLAVGLSSLLTEKEGQPVYPYMEGKLNVPIGRNEQGQPQYASGFGLPFEALTQIPNLSGSPQQSGRELERILGGSSQPLLKTAFGLVSGEDPYFETPFGSYSKLPGNIEGGEAGRIYNVLAGTGLISPVSEPLRLIGKAADERSGVGTKALDLLTGANIVTVDENRALQQRLTDYLRRNPDVQSFEALSSKSGDPEVKVLLKQLRNLKSGMKEQRKKAKALTVTE